jgi:PAS domain S-box-containing protein
LEQFRRPGVLLHWGLGIDSLQTAHSLPTAAKDHPLRHVLDTALDAVIVMASDGSIIDWNDIASATFGWSQTEAVGAILSDLISPPQFRDAHKQGLEKFMSTGVGPVLRKRIEVSALRKSGEEFPVELSIAPYGENGERLFLGFLRDITARKQAAARLERQALQAKLLYETISYAAEATSFEAALRTCLEAVQKITGWPVGHVYLPSDADASVLVPSNIWFPDADDRYEALKDVTTHTQFARGKGLPGHVMQTGKPVWISDVLSDDRFTRAQAVGNLAIRSALGFPIKNAGSTIAVVEFFTPVQSEPDPELLFTLRSIGDQVGRVFERRLSEMKLKETSRHQKLLLRELNHRVKNMLTVVTGIASQTMRNSTTMQQFNRSFLERLHALSQAHSLLAAQNWGPTPLRSLVDQVLAPHGGALAQVAIEGPSVNLTPKIALALNLVLHELATNAVKYGALANANGKLDVHWQAAVETPSILRLTWRERGVAGVTAPEKTGFGTRLINATIRKELRGKLDVHYDGDGLCYDMEFPLAPAGAAGKSQ